MFVGLMNNVVVNVFVDINVVNKCWYFLWLVKDRFCRFFKLNSLSSNLVMILWYNFIFNKLVFCFKDCLIS